MRYRMLALDLDGTALDPAGKLRPQVREAVSKARDVGVQVVLCTGRRYRTSNRFLREMQLDGPSVFQNGVVVKDASDGRTLRHDYLTQDAYRAALPLLRRVTAPLVYIDEPETEIDIVAENAEAAHPYQREYLDDNSSNSRFVESLGPPPSAAIVMMSCLAEAAVLRDLDADLMREGVADIQTNFLTNKNYRGHILEVVSAGSGKWGALSRLAAERGVGPEEILAIGDDHNDVEMLTHSGLGVAMENAVPAARAAARHVVASNANDGVVEAIERWIIAPRR